MSTNILLASAHPIVRNSLRSLLEREPQFRVLAEAANGREAVVLAEYKRPDIVLLDVKLPGVTGIAAAREISSKQHNVGIVFVAAETDEEYLSEAARVGARAYVSAETAQNDLVRAILVVVEGGYFVSPSIAGKLIEKRRRAGEFENAGLPELVVRSFGPDFEPL